MEAEPRCGTDRTVPQSATKRNGPYPCGDEYPSAMNFVLLGARLKKAREDRGWSQDVVAEKADMTRGYIGHIEAGRRDAPIRSLEAVAKALDLTLEVVVRDSAAGVDSELLMLLEMATPDARAAVRRMLELLVSVERKTA